MIGNYGTFLQGEGVEVKGTKFQKAVASQVDEVENFVVGTMAVQEARTAKDAREGTISWQKETEQMDEEKSRKGEEDVVLSP